MIVEDIGMKIENGLKIGVRVWEIKFLTVLKNNIEKIYCSNWMCLSKVFNIFKNIYF